MSRHAMIYKRRNGKIAVHGIDANGIERVVWIPENAWYLVREAGLFSDERVYAVVRRWLRDISQSHSAEIRLQIRSRLCFYGDALSSSLEVGSKEEA